MLYPLRLAFGSAMLVTIVLGFAAIRRRDVTRHRAWMIRSYAIGLVAGTQVFTLGIGGVVFGTGDLSTALLMGAAWAINLAVAERAIRKRTRRRVAGDTTPGWQCHDRARSRRRRRRPGYELRIEGHLDEHWSTWFDGLTLIHEDDGTTTLRGAVTDQAELHGLLAKVRDLGATLISVTTTDTHERASGTPDEPRRRRRVQPATEVARSAASAARPGAVTTRTIGGTMSHPIPATLYRIGAVAGCGSAVILLINAAKRAEVIPTSAFTQLVAPLAQILALALVTALYLAFGRRAGTFGLVAFLLNAFSLAALVGVEFVINLVFADLPDDTDRGAPGRHAGRRADRGIHLVPPRHPRVRHRHAPQPRGPHGAARPVRRRCRTGLAASLRARGGAGPRTRHHGRRRRLARDLALQPLRPHQTWADHAGPPTSRGSRRATEVPLCHGEGARPASPRRAPRGRGLTGPA